MNFYEFASSSPLLTFFSILVIVTGIEAVVKEIRKFVNPSKRKDDEI